MIVLDKLNFFGSHLKARHLLGFSFLMIISCESKNDMHLRGLTMGTTYSVVLPNINEKINKNLLQVKVDSLLAQINFQMSTYIENSEISNFNSKKDTGPIDISLDFYNVIQTALKISKLSEGAFDITIMPLIRLWGFGPENKGKKSVPSIEEIKLYKKNTGISFLKSGKYYLKKVNTELEIDLSAIAKGYAIDKIKSLFELLQLEHYLIEIGGEIICKGKNADGLLWRIGIDNPSVNSKTKKENNLILGLSDVAVATSGDYRNYFEVNDIIYSHIIDPMTGYPVKNVIASATVVAPNCAEADAWATALLVMGVKGLDILEELNGFEGLIFSRVNNGFQRLMTSGFEKNIIQ